MSRPPMPLPIAWCLVLLIGFAGLASADEVCDSIAEVADGWDDLGTAADAVAAGEVGDAEAGEIEAAIEDSISPTRDLGRELANLGDPTATRLSHRLLADLSELEATDTFADAVTMIDRIVDDLDSLVAECDEQSTGADLPAGGGKIPVSYQAPADPAFAQMATAIRDSGIFEALSALVIEVLSLPRDLPASFESCGQPNAFYSSDTGRVTMCWEFFALFDQIFQELAPEDRWLAVLDTGSFFFLHEIGHALVDQLDIPVTGREEDSVDGLAALIMIQEGGADTMAAVLGNFAALAALEEQSDLAFWDEHSLSAQRLYDMACLLYGSNPEQHAGLISPELLPVERAERCPREYEEKDRAWDLLLSPYYAQP